MLNTQFCGISCTTHYHGAKHAFLAISQNITMATSDHTKSTTLLLFTLDRSTGNEKNHTLNQKFIRAISLYYAPYLEAFNF